MVKNSIFYYFLLGLLSISVYSTSQAAPVPKGLEQTLKSWQPKLSLSDEGALKVVLNEKEVTKTIFSSLTTSGICASVWLKQVKGDLAGVKQVYVLNKQETQGLVFNGGKEACDKMGKMESDESKKYLEELTFIYGKHPNLTDDVTEVKKVENKFDCGKKNCGQMSSCEEAIYKLKECGHIRLDRDKNGIPCETICN